MKLNYHFLTHELNGETLIVPTAGADFHGLIQGNKTLAAIAECLKSETTEEQITDTLSLAAIAECLKSETTEEQITDTLCAHFDGDREIIAADVAEAIARLREIGAIDE